MEKTNWDIADKAVFWYGGGMVIVCFGCVAYLLATNDALSLWQVSPLIIAGVMSLILATSPLWLKKEKKGEDKK